MPTYCVSDLHLCDRGPRDNFCFEGREQQFYRFLNFVQSNRGRLLILGDLFDWWQVPVGAAVVAYRPLLDRLGDMGATWIVGNHDNALAPLTGTELMPDHPLLKTACGPFEEIIGGRKIAYLHGHEADPYCCDLNPGTGEITAIISGMLEDRNRGPFRNHHAVEDQFVGTLESALTLWRKLTFQRGRQEEMVDGVEQYRQNQKADVVIYGHTHEPGCIGDFHFNTGSWARHHDTFVCISDGGMVSIWEWVPDHKPVPFDVKLR
jgi:UDP-2,3-diacylglucosamine pyrophosphatase LpxH